jgi:hypothetical protein
MALQLALLHNNNGEWCYAALFSFALPNPSTIGSPSILALLVGFQQHKLLPVSSL